MCDLSSCSSFFVAVKELTATIRYNSSQDKALAFQNAHTETFLKRNVFSAKRL